MYYAWHQKEPTDQRYPRAYSVRALPRWVTKTALKVLMQTIVLGMTGFCLMGQTAAANQSIATSQIKIVKTASVQAQVAPAYVLATSAHTGATHSIPFCIHLDAPYSVSTDSGQLPKLSDASTGKTVSVQPHIADSSIFNNSTHCRSKPHAIKVTIEQDPRNSLDAGRYAGSMRVMIIVE